MNAFRNVALTTSDSERCEMSEAHLNAAVLTSRCSWKQLPVVSVSEHFGLGRGVGITI